MTLRAFSKSLLELYDLAEHAGPHAFPQEAARIVQRHIAFDGALLCTHANPSLPARGRRGQGGGTRDRSPDLRYRFIFGPPQDAAPLEAGSLAPVCRLLATVEARPVALDVSHLPPPRSSDDEARALQPPSLRKLLLYGDTPGTASQGRALVLYRHSTEDFSEREATMLEAIWHHLARTISLNLSRTLDRMDVDRDARALALVNSHGAVDAANEAMAELMALEWGRPTPHSLPLPVIASLLSNSCYRGRHIELRASQKFGYLACRAHQLPAVDKLAPSERKAADHFAKGLSHSQVAKILHVSPHTVRNQLANVYQKLGVHSKIELMRVMSSR